MRAAPTIAELEEIVSRLATSAGRQVGSAGHAAARSYLVEELARRGLEGYLDGAFELGFPLGRERGTNVVGVLAGSRPELPPVLLGAHYDTCGAFPGADDNAAAIAILLCAVGPLRALGLERSLLIAFFDAEEPPFFLSPEMGSTWFYEKQRKGPIHSALVLDLVGHDVAVRGWEDLVFVTGLESDPALVGVFERAAPALEGLRALPTLTRYIGDMSDYRPFRLDRKPYVFLSCGRWEHYHRATDTPEKLNYPKMAALSRYVVELVGGLAAAELSGPFEGLDTTELELRCFREIAAPLLERFGQRLEDRRDLDRFVAMLIASFGLN